MSKKTKPEAEEQEQVKTEAPAEETAKADAKPATDWEAKYNDLNDRYLRMAAEYDNFRKRSQREREQAYTDAVSRAVTALLPTYDNLERALKAETADTEYKKGVELTMTQLTESLKGINVTVIDAAAGTALIRTSTTRLCTLRTKASVRMSSRRPSSRASRLAIRLFAMRW